MTVAIFHFNTTIQTAMFEVKVMGRLLRGRVFHFRTSADCEERLGCFNAAGVPVASGSVRMLPASCNEHDDDEADDESDARAYAAGDEHCYEIRACVARLPHACSKNDAFHRKDE